MSGNSKKSPAGAILALLILVIIVVALIFILRGGGEDKDVETDAPNAGDVSEVLDGSTAPENTEPPTDGDDGADKPSEAPTETAEPTPSPTPSPTPAPTPEPTPNLSATSGSFESDTGTGLNIVVDWTLTPKSDGGATLSMKVSTESYSLYNNAAWHALSVQIGGQTWEFDTEAIEYAGPGLDTNELSTAQIELSGTSLPATATVTWHFQGSYGGTELENVVATGTIS